MTAQHQIRLLCDSCPQEFEPIDGVTSVKLLRMRANQQGWRVYAHGSKDACPRCARKARDQKKRLGDQR